MTPNERAWRSWVVGMAHVLCRRRERAKAKGVRRRPPKLTAHQKKEAIRRRDHGEETLAEIGRSDNVSGWTIARLFASKINRRSDARS